jgi:branched-chain amino acid transport system substrate-binding protein
MNDGISAIRKASISLCLNLLLLGVTTCLPAHSWSSTAPIKIAAIFALTGPAAASNILSIEGVRWAVEEINAGGGVLGRRLELIEIDNQSTPIGSKVAADKAVQSRVTAIVGPAWSSHSIPVARVAQANKIPMISNISTHPDLTRIGDYIFRVCFNDLTQGRVMAQFAYKKLHLRKVAICINLSDDYSRALSDSFQAVFEKLGGTIPGRVAYNPRQPNFRETVQSIKDLEPDTLFIPGFDESGGIVSETQRLGLHAVPLGGDGWDSETFFSTGGDRIDLGYYSTHWSPEVKNDKSIAFVAKYGSRQNPLLANAALSFDAVYILADALRRAGTVAPEPLRDALAATRDYQGVTGRIGFDERREPVKNVVIMRIVKGQRKYYTQVEMEP